MHLAEFWRGLTMLCAWDLVQREAECLPLCLHSFLTPVSGR